MAGTSARAGGPIRRYLIGLVAVAAAALALVAAVQIGTLLPGGAAAATGNPATPTGLAPSGVTVEPSPTTTPTASPPAPEPTPVLVPAPLTGLLVSPEAAARQPIAVMIDDQAAARPQSGFNAASVVWHAPAEGGIPRYMLIFQDEIPTGVGPVRSARQYYIEWAAEWNALYVHAGGSPQAIATLYAHGNGQWVYNADEFRWGGVYLWRATDRLAPHNVYTDGKNLRRLAKHLGADDEPLEQAWRFGPDKAPELRPDGGVIRVSYPYETVTYRYDAATNTYPRYIDASKRPQKDRADGRIVAPKNVVILRMVFGALDDGHPDKHRLEAQNVGRGEAWIATGGVTVKGEWRKKSPTAPTRLFGPDGERITLTAGQTFVQVIPTTASYRIKDGRAPSGSIVPRLAGVLGP